MKKLILIIITLILLVINANSTTQVTLAWDANDPTPDGYRIFMREGNAYYDYSNPIWDGQTTYATITNLKDNTVYYFVVRAYNKVAESADSIEVKYISETDEIKVITKPTNLKKE